METKAARLRADLARLGSVAVAYSGGTDSSYLLAVALDVLGPSPVLALTADSPLTPRAELGEARALAAELGARHLVLLETERSTVRWKGPRIDKQLIRLRRIADEATRQSRAVWRTKIEGPVSAAMVLADAALAEPGVAPLPTDEAMIAIGPEGGWSPEELALTPARVGLGANILRVETAAVAATTLRLIR